MFSRARMSTFNHTNRLVNSTASSPTPPSKRLWYYPTLSSLIHNWSFGALVGLFFVVQLVVRGVFLATHYTPYPKHPWNLAKILRGVSGVLFISAVFTAVGDIPIGSTSVNPVLALALICPYGSAATPKDLGTVFRFTVSRARVEDPARLTTLLRLLLALNWNASNSLFENALRLLLHKQRECWAVGYIGMQGAEEEALRSYLLLLDVIEQIVLLPGARAECLVEIRATSEYMAAFRLNQADAVYPMSAPLNRIARALKKLEFDAALEERAGEYSTFMFVKFLIPATILVLTGITYMVTLRLLDTAAVFCCLTLAYFSTLYWWGGK